MMDDRVSPELMEKIARIDFQGEILPIFELFPDAIAIIDSDNIVTRVNRHFPTLFGYTAEEITGRSLEMLVPDELRDEFFNLNRNVLSGDQIHHESIRLAKDGTGIDVLIRGIKIEQTDGSQLIIAIYTDIRKRKEAERNLLDERDRAQRYLDTAAVMLLALDVDGTITLINNKGCEILGGPEEEILGKNWFREFLPEEEQDQVETFFRAMVKGESDLVDHYENSVISSSGERKSVSWHNTFLRDGSGTITGTFSSGEDITEKIVLEKRLLDARKLESVGRLAGAVAHDFNNLLTVISGTAEILSLTGDIVEGSQTSKRLNSIREAAGKAAVLIDKLTSYGRQQYLHATIFDLNVTVAELGKLLRQTLQDNIEIFSSLADTPAMIEVDPTHMERVILDLAIYAGQSMPSNGSLTISVEIIDLDLDRITSELLMLQPGRYVLLSMTNTGVPIPEEDLPTIFEPRLASQEAGTVDGYILPSVLGFVTQSGGDMSVSSGPAGTTFRIWFTALDVVHEPVTPSVERTTADITGGTILVVDDEPEVREMIVTILDAIGYQVLEAGDGLAALEIIDSESVDLLITDTIMPRMGGVELVRQIAERGLAINTILVSGYPGEEIIEREGLASDSVFLQKPFTVSTLTELVQQHM
ncbi:PAS domain S-box protein [Gemmatimonadota bacterium]